MDDAIAAREQLLKQADDSLATLRTLHEDLKRTVVVNIDSRIKMRAWSWSSSERARIHWSFARNPDGEECSDGEDHPEGKENEAVE